jgi:hypothetical protein
MFDCIIKSAGVDWVTLTSTDEGDKRLFNDSYGRVAAADALLGFETKSAVISGFSGKKARHAFLGQREERAMLQVSGYNAQRQVVLRKTTQHCTRLDIQVTVQIAPGAVNRFLDAAERVARAAPAVRGHKPNIKAVRGERGNETVFIGKRVSEVFMRMYDKYEESKDEYYRDCVRFEVEIKGKAARALWNQIALMNWGVGYLLSVLRHFFERRGIAFDWFDMPVESVAPPEHQRSHRDKTIGWLASQVAPSVARLCAYESFFSAFHVLFGRALTEHDFTVIMNAWSVAT